MSDNRNLIRWVDRRIKKAVVVKESYIVRGEFVNAACARDYEAFLREFRKYLVKKLAPVSSSNDLKENNKERSR